MFNFFGNKKVNKKGFEEIRQQREKNRLLYLKALEKYDNLKNQS